MQAPTLILHRRRFGLWPIAHSRYLAEHIPGAKLVELPGSDVDLFWGTPELALDAIQEFLTVVRRSVEPSRVLATVLFTTSSAPPSGPPSSGPPLARAAWGARRDRPDRYGTSIPPCDNGSAADGP